MIRIAPGLFALLLCLPPGDSALAGSARLEAVSNGHFVTKADINGRSITVLVDTGATSVALSHEDAQEAGLRPGTLDFDVPVATANGVVKAARVKIRRVAIGSVRVENVEGMVLPKGAMRGSLLGMSFLSRLDSFRIEDGVLHLRN